MEDICKALQTHLISAMVDNLNKALEPVNIKLEFIEAISNPFDLDGFQNFVRFRVVELDK